MRDDVDQRAKRMKPPDLGWRERTQRERALMDHLLPLLRKRAAGRDISGLNAYEQ